MSSGGQSTAELAVLLPVMMILILTVVQVGLVARDHVSVQHAAREAARSVSLSPEVGTARRGVQDAATGLDTDRLMVSLSGGNASGDVATVHVSYEAPTEVPIVGRLVGDVLVTGEAAVRVE